MYLIFLKNIKKIKTFFKMLKKFHSSIAVKIVEYVCVLHVKMNRETSWEYWQ